MQDYIIKQHLNLIAKSKTYQLKLLQTARPIPKISSETVALNFSDLKSGIEQKNIKEGDLVTFDGYFSKYGQTYFPLTYMPTLPTSASLEDEKEPEYVSISDDITIPRIKGTMQFKIKCYQLPVENIPYVKIDNVYWKIGFLYPPDFTGFIFEEDRSYDKTKLRQLCLKIPTDACPLIVVFDYKSFEEYVEANIKITAQIIFLEREILEGISCGLDNLQPILYKNCFVNIENAPKAICLLLTKQTGTIELKNKRNVNGNLLIEGYFENAEFLVNFQKIFSDSVPNAPKIDIRAMSYPPYTNYGAFIPISSVNFVFRSPSIFGIFTDSILNDAEIEKNINLIRKYYFPLIRNIYMISSVQKNKNHPFPKIFFLPDINQETLFGINIFLNT